MDIDAQRVVHPLAVNAGEVFGGQLTLLAIETMPNSFVLRYHHDIDWAVETTSDGQGREEHPDRHPTMWGRWEISDDHDMECTGARLAGHGADGWWGDITFDVPLDVTARHLNVSLVAAGQRVFEVDLQLDEPIRQPSD